MKNILFKKWTKAYVGPFSKKDAEFLVEELSVNSAIGMVKMRSRNKKLNQYDIYIK